MLEKIKRLLGIKKKSPPRSRAGIYEEKIKEGFLSIADVRSLQDRGVL